MKIQVLVGGNHGDYRVEAGEVVEVPDKVGRAFIECGMAEKASEPRTRKVTDGSDVPLR